MQHSAEIMTFCTTTWTIEVLWGFFSECQLVTAIWWKDNYLLRAQNKKKCVWATLALLILPPFLKVLQLSLKRLSRDSRNIKIQSGSVVWWVEVGGAKLLKADWPGKAELSEWNCAEFIPPKSADKLSGQKLRDLPSVCNPAFTLAEIPANSEYVHGCQWICPTFECSFGVRSCSDYVYYVGHVFLFYVLCLVISSLYLLDFLLEIELELFYGKQQKLNFFICSTLLV